MDWIDPTLKKLGVGLSRLLRYSFGGFLFIALAALVNPTSVNTRLGGIPWEVTALAALVVGAGFYAAHRSLIVPAHHLSLCFVLFVTDCCGCVFPQDSTSPTRWLGSLGVPWFRRMLAYTTLRRCDLFSEYEKEALNISHAESGLVIMLAEGFALAALYVAIYPSDVQVTTLWLIAGACLIASYPGAVAQHRLECMYLRARPIDVKRRLRKYGILPTNTSA
jgi:hypothetical protein